MACIQCIQPRKIASNQNIANDDNCTSEFDVEDVKIRRSFVTCQFRLDLPKALFVLRKVDNLKNIFLKAIIYINWIISRRDVFFLSTTIYFNIFVDNENIFHLCIFIYDKKIILKKYIFFKLFIFMKQMKLKFKFEFCSILGFLIWVLIFIFNFFSSHVL